MALNAATLCAASVPQTRTCWQYRDLRQEGARALDMPGELRLSK